MLVGEACIYVDPNNVSIGATITTVYEPAPAPTDHVDVIYFEPGTPDAIAVTVVNVPTNRLAGGAPYVWQES